MRQHMYSSDPRLELVYELLHNIVAPSAANMEPELSELMSSPIYAQASLHCKLSYEQ